MMVMTAKVQKKKILLGLLVAAALVAAAMLLFREPAQPTSAPASVSDNDARVRFFTEQGWQVTPSPKESGQVTIPQTPTELYLRYNALQKSQGYDLTEYAGKSAMRYVYEIRNYPGATAPVYGTLLVYKGKIIGGDITDTSPKGAIQGFQKKGNAQTPSEKPTETTAPDSTAPTA